MSFPFNYYTNKIANCQPTTTITLPVHVPVKFLRFVRPAVHLWQLYTATELEVTTDDDSFATLDAKIILKLLH